MVDTEKKSDTNVVCVIPARMGSTRFPGKPLARLHGMTMIEHVYRRCALSPVVDSVWVATCDDAIVDEVKRFGGHAVMTSNEHERCTDRVAEAVKAVAPTADIIVNVQGDEPLLHPNMIALAVNALCADNTVSAVHMVAPINSDADFDDANEVKVVFDLNWNTLYCSREAIPSRRKGGHGKRWKQVCVIPFWREFLFQFNALPQAPLEIIESVDMMRAVEHGYTIRCVESPYQTISVDTPDDLSRAAELLKHDPLFPYS